MTREEAIINLKDIRTANEYNLKFVAKSYLVKQNYKELIEACNIAIQALSQEPCTDAVSRGVFEQVMWERDIAIGQLKELGYDFGQKIEPYEPQESEDKE